MHYLFGVDESRFTQTHSKIYFAGILVFLVFFLLERFFALASRFVSYLFKRLGLESDLEDSFSIDIFKDFTPEVQEKEAIVVKNEIKHVETLLLRRDAPEKQDLYEYYKQRLL